MENYQIAKYLYEIADFLEATKDSIRARAYRRAANIISNLTVKVTDLINNRVNLQELKYIGKGISSIIHHILLGNFNSIEFILNSNSFKKQLQKPPFRLHNAKKLTELINYIFTNIKGVEGFYAVGDLRREKELIQNLRYLIVINSHFEWEELKKNKFITMVNKLTKTVIQITILNNIQCEIETTQSQQLGEHLLLLTGSDQHINQLKKIVGQKNFSFPKLSEEDIYRQLGLAYIPPELREDKGEIAAAQRVLPTLIQFSDIKGDLHCHTNETDGVLSLEKVVEYAIQKGYQYIAVTDHSQRLKITNGLNKKRLFKQIAQIDKLNATLKNFTILKSSECDILEDGTLDFPEEVLKELDLVVCSVHSLFRLDREKQTQRIIRAIQNPYCTILGHPTGRLISRRMPYDVDMARIFEAAKEYKCVLELNSQPYRLDLNADYCRLVKSMGIKISLSSDAHSLRGFDFMRLGVTQARKAGLEAEDIINTYSLEKLKKNLRKK